MVAVVNPEQVSAGDSLCVARKGGDKEIPFQENFMVNMSNAAWQCVLCVPVVAIGECDTPLVDSPVLSEDLCGIQCLEYA